MFNLNYPKPKDSSLETPPDILKRVEVLDKQLNLKEQWESQVKALNEAGVLELLPEAINKGIIDINDQEQPIPTYTDIIEALKHDKEQLAIVEKKTEQYENPKLLLVPIGMPINTLIDRYKKLILRKHKEGNLKSTNGDKLPLNENDPFYVWDQIPNSDIEGRMVYQPKQFTEKDHRGLTKKQLIETQGAWQVMLIEDIDIPKEGRGKTLGSPSTTLGARKQLEANQSSEQYLKSLQTDKQYQFEQGPTPESELTYAITKLQAENQQIDDYQGTGKSCFLTGAYLPVSGNVPYFYWLRDDQQATLDGYDPVYRRESCGSRAGVRIKIPKKS